MSRYSFSNFDFKQTASLQRHYYNHATSTTTTASQQPRHPHHSANHTATMTSQQPRQSPQHSDLYKQKHTPRKSPEEENKSDGYKNQMLRRETAEDSWDSPRRPGGGRGGSSLGKGSKVKEGRALISGEKPTPAPPLGAIKSRVRWPKRQLS